jgi:hypothetical protein
MRTSLSFVLLTLFLLSCDPPYVYEVKGRVISNKNNEPISGVQVDYTFLPSDQLNHWRVVTSGDSTTFTDQAGYFYITVETITLAFDSVHIKLTKEGFQDHVLLSASKDWKLIARLPHRKVGLDLGEISMD